MEFDPRLEELNRREADNNVPLVITVGIILCLGLAGNAIAFVFYAFINKKTVTNFLIAVLAFNDMMTNLIFFDEMYVHVEQFKFTSHAGCKLVYVINNWVLVNSVSLMLVIAIERHRKICHPLSWQISKFRAKVAVLVVTVVTLVVCCREAIFADIVPEHILMKDNSTVIGYVCVHSHDDNLKPIIKGSNVFTMVVYVALFSGIIVCYSLIICKIYKTKVHFSTIGNKANSEKSETTSVSKQEAQRNPSEGEQGSGRSTDNDEDNKETETDKTYSVKDTVSTYDIEPGLQKVSNQANNNTHIEIREVIGEEGLNSGIDKTSNSDNTQMRLEVNKNLTGASRKYPQDKLTSVERRLTVMVIVIAITSVLSFLPYFLVILLMPSHYSTEENLSNMTKKVVRESYKLNGVINPIIMGIFCSHFRQYMANIMCRCFRRKNI